MCFNFLFTHRPLYNLWFLFHRVYQSGHEDRVLEWSDELLSFCFFLHHRNFLFCFPETLSFNTRIHHTNDKESFACQSKHSYGIYHFTFTLFEPLWLIILLQSTFFSKVSLQLNVLLDQIFFHVLDISNDRLVRTISKWSVVFHITQTVML